MDIAGIALVHGLVQGAGMITDLDLNQKGMVVMKFMEEFVTCIVYRLDTSLPLSWLSVIITLMLTRFA